MVLTIDTTLGWRWAAITTSTPADQNAVPCFVLRYFRLIAGDLPNGARCITLTGVSSHREIVRESRRLYRRLGATDPIRIACGEGRPLVEVNLRLSAICLEPYTDRKCCAALCSNQSRTGLKAVVVVEVLERSGAMDCP